MLIRSMLGPRQTERIEAGEDVDFSYTLPDGRRQRVNVYRERGRLAAAIRLLNDAVPTLEELSLPAHPGQARAAFPRPHSGDGADRERQIHHPRGDAPLHQ